MINWINHASTQQAKWPLKTVSTDKRLSWTLPPVYPFTYFELFFKKIVGETIEIKHNFQHLRNIYIYNLISQIKSPLLELRYMMHARWNRGKQHTNLRPWQELWSFILPILLQYWKINKIMIMWINGQMFGTTIP